MRRKRLLGGIGAFAVAAVLGVPAVVLAGADGSGAAQFGNPNAGTDFPPGEHDRSFNGIDKIIPRTVVISAGGTMSFDVEGFHQVAVYEAGTTPADIAAPAFPPNLFVNDPEDRIYLGPLQADSTTPAGTFATPGTYLMICNVNPHFLFAKMYGWVIVK